MNRRQFAQQRVRPVLGAMGYVGRGPVFRYLDPSGPMAVVHLRDTRGLHVDIEFTVDVALVLPEWRRFILDTIPGAPPWSEESLPKLGEAAGAMRETLKDPRPTLVPRSLPNEWRMGSEDLDRQAVAIQAIEKAAITRRAWADRARLMTLLRAKDPSLRPGLFTPHEVLLAVMLAQDGHLAEARAFALASDWQQTERLVGWIDGL